MEIRHGLFALILGLFSAVLVQAQTVSFPGAEGYGRFATGGRGTLPDGRTLFLKAKVIEVTNLDDDGIGSFRWALTQQDTTVNGVKMVIPATIVFRVGGVINLKSDIHRSNKHLTIAGQTAPGDGICFRGGTVNFSGSENIIVRYIRSRPGDELGLETSAFRIENGKTFIIDHCSFSWAIEETTHFSSNENTSVQWCIISESLYNSFHKKGPRGYGTQWGGEYASYHHNLLAHHNSRMPRINGSNENDLEALVDYRNNVNYNWGSKGAFYGGEWMKTGGKGFAHTNVVNNYFIPGPATSSERFFARPSQGDVGYGKWYINGNIMVGDVSKTANNWLGIDPTYVVNLDSIRSDIEHVKTDGVLEQYSHYTQSAEVVYSSILNEVGATLPKRDAHDIRLIKEMKGEIAVLRYEYVDSTGQVSPEKGVGNGLIDTQVNLVSPEDRAAGNDAWSVYKTSGPDEAPVDTDHDGMPDDWELDHNLNPNDYSDFRIIGPSGYTNLEIYLADLTGVKVSSAELPLPDFSVFPNPTDGTVIINCEKEIQNISVFELSGKRLSCIGIKGNSSTLNLSGLDKGCYVLEINTTCGNCLHKKLIKR